jgi:hypothetical protein
MIARYSRLLLLAYISNALSRLDYSVLHRETNLNHVYFTLLT